MRCNQWTRRATTLLLCLTAAACGSDKDDTDDTNDAGQTLCAKYGGAKEIPGIVEKVLEAISGDCRVNSFFASLSEDKLTHISDCMVIQVGELFGCPGVEYAGSEDSAGEPCRNMKESHDGLGISKGDFDALVDDMAEGLSAAGVDAEDIEAAAPAFTDMEPDIVESDDTDPSQDACEPLNGRAACSTPEPH